MTFSNISDLIKKASGKRIYVRLGNGYFCSVDKTDLKKVAKQVSVNGETFAGKILNVADTFIQIDF